jgi:excisionase family DNA binding protein
MEIKMIINNLQSQKKVIYNKENKLFNNLEWMDSREASEYLRTTIGSLRNMVYKGQLPAKKLGSRLRFKKSDLDFLLNSSDSIRRSY